MKPAFILTFIFAYLSLYGQTERSLHHYIEIAKVNSPLIRDLHNQTAIRQSEIERLKAFYTHSRLEVNGEYLFVPVVSINTDKIAFKFNAEDGTEYYGYDVGESSGHLHAGITWTKPLLGNSMYHTAKEQELINLNIISNSIHMEEHQLERLVTEQYLLCMLDKTQIAFTDSIISLFERQKTIVQKLAISGLAKTSDLQLIQIECESNRRQRLSYIQSYHSHLMDLNFLCGINDTINVALSEVEMSIPFPNNSSFHSRFTEQFTLDSLKADADFKSFCMQYKPRLDLFINCGLRTGSFDELYKHIGWNAGLTFSWTISDGLQREKKQRQLCLNQNTILIYRDYAEYQQQMQLSRCMAEINDYNQQEVSIRTQLSQYDVLLESYNCEITAGQMSILDYIMVLKNKTQTEKDLIILQTNKKLAIVAYNYWNW